MTPRRASLAALVVAALGAASPLAAQTAPPTGGVALVDAVRDEVRQRLRRAGDLFRAENYDGATVEFERAYELMAGHPRRADVLFNIAQCHERTSRYDRALEVYQRYLREAPADASDRPSVEATMRALDGLLGTVRVSSNVRGAEVWVDDRRVGVSPGEVRVPGGRHTVQLRARGYLPGQQEVQVPARARREVTIDLERVPEHRGLRPGYFWASAGISAVALGIGTAFGALALSARGDVQSRLDDPLQRFSVTQTDIDGVASQATLADVFLGTGVVFGIGAGVLAILTDWGGRRPTPEAAAPPRAALHVAPVPQGSGAGLILRGGF